MFRFALIGSLVCAALFAAAASSAQTPQIRGPAARAVTQPLVTIITPVQRAQLASRLAAEPIDAAEISEPISVNVLSPVIGDPNAPTLALSGHGVSEWRTLGAEPRIFLIARDRSWARITMQLSGGYRYLVVCNMESRGLETRDSWNGLAITWEGLHRGAVLIPAEDADRRTYFDLYPLHPGAWVSGCEVSRIG
jgi:hypothetical protein